MKALKIQEVVIAPHSPWQSPCVVRVIGTLRRECLDHVVILGEAHLRRILRKYLDRILFWASTNLEDKLLDFSDYFNSHRTHSSLEGRTRDQDTGNSQPYADLHSYQGQSHCRGLYQTPIAA